MCLLYCLFSIVANCDAFGKKYYCRLLIIYLRWILLVSSLLSLLINLFFQTSFSTAFTYTDPNRLLMNTVITTGN